MCVRVCVALYKEMRDSQWRSQGGARGVMAPPKLLANVFFLQLILGNLEVTRKWAKKIPGIEVI